MTAISPNRFHPFRLVILIIIPLLPIVARAEVGVEVNGIAAKVNGRVITKNEVLFLLTPKWENLKKQFPEGGAEFEAQFAEVKKGVLQELIDRHVLIDQFANLGIEIAPKIIEEEIQRELRDNYQGKVELLRDALKSSRMTMESFRNLLHERLLETEIKKRQLKDQ